MVGTLGCKQKIKDIMYAYDYEVDCFNIMILTVRLDRKIN
jgi:hypothetical protein